VLPITGKEVSGSNRGCSSKKKVEITDGYTETEPVGPPIGRCGGLPPLKKENKRPCPRPNAIRNKKREGMVKGDL